MSAITIAAALSAWLVQPVAVELATTPSPVLVSAPAGAEGALSLEADPAFLRALPVAVDGLLGATPATSVRLDLFPDASIEAHLDEITHHGDGSVSWVGHRVDAPDDLIVFTRHGPRWNATIQDGSRLFGLRPGPDSTHLAYEIDTTVGACGTDDDQTAGLSLDWMSWETPWMTITAPVDAGGAEPVAAIQRDPTPSVRLNRRDPAPYGVADVEPIDVLVLYTEAVRAALDPDDRRHDGVRSRLQLAVLYANRAYENTEVDTRIRMVHTEMIPAHVLDEATFGKGACGLVNSLPEHDIGGIHALRDEVGADAVVILYRNLESSKEKRDKLTGCANLMTRRNKDAFGKKGYAAVKLSALDDHTLTHELGHVMGAQHGRRLAKEAGWGGYGYGYTDDAKGYHTIMSRAPNSPRRNVFSNPRVVFPKLGGRVAGISVEDDRDRAADNARVLEQTFPILRGLREREVESRRADRVRPVGGRPGGDSMFTWFGGPRFDIQEAHAKGARPLGWVLELGPAEGSAKFGRVAVPFGERHPLVEVPGLPEDVELHARLWTQVAPGDWRYRDRSWKAR